MKSQLFQISSTLTSNWGCRDFHDSLPPVGAEFLSCWLVGLSGLQNVWELVESNLEVFNVKKLLQILVLGLRVASGVWTTSWGLGVMKWDGFECLPSKNKVDHRSSVEKCNILRKPKASKVGNKNMFSILVSLLTKCHLLIGWPGYKGASLFDACALEI